MSGRISPETLSKILLHNKAGGLGCGGNLGWESTMK